MFNFAEDCKNPAFVIRSKVGTVPVSIIFNQLQYSQSWYASALLPLAPIGRGEMSLYQGESLEECLQAVNGAMDFFAGMNG